MKAFKLKRTAELTMDLLDPMDSTLIDFMKPNAQVCTWLHRTSGETAQFILENGFRFKYELHRTADSTRNMVSVEEVESGVEKHWSVETYESLHNKRIEHYGDHTVVLGISEGLLDSYLDRMHPLITDFRKLMKLFHEVEPEETIIARIYTLPRQFVKGYFGPDNVVIENADFDPDYNSPAFEENLSEANVRAKGSVG